MLGVLPSVSFGREQTNPTPGGIQRNHLTAEQMQQLEQQREQLELQQKKAEDDLERAPKKPGGFQRNTLTRQDMRQREQLKEFHTAVTGMAAEELEKGKSNILAYKVTVYTDEKKILWVSPYRIFISGEKESKPKGFFNPSNEADNKIIIPSNPNEK